MSIAQETTKKPRPTKAEKQAKYEPAGPVKEIWMDDAGMARLREIIAEEGLDPLPEGAKLMIRFQPLRECEVYNAMRVG